MSFFDVVGQEILPNEIVSHDGHLYVITKVHPKTVRLSDKSTVVSHSQITVVTTNLLALGKDDLVDEMRAEFASEVDMKIPKPPKIPIRYVVVTNPKDLTNTQWLIRVEMPTMSEARDNLKDITAEHGIDISHAMQGRYWRNMYWSLDANHLIALDNLPADIRGLTGLANPVVELPEHAKFSGTVL